MCHRRKRASSLDIVCDQQRRSPGRLRLHQRLEHAFPESVPVRTEGRVGLHAASADAPIAGGGIVDRVVETGRRDQRRGPRERLAHVVADGHVAFGAGEYAGQFSWIHAGALACARRDFQGDGHCIGRPTSLGWRENCRHGTGRRLARSCRFAPQHRSSEVPSWNARRPQGDAVYECSVRGCGWLTHAGPCRRAASNCCRRNQMNC